MICIAKQVAHPNVNISPKLIPVPDGFKSKKSPIVARVIDIQTLEEICCRPDIISIMGTIIILILVINADLLGVVEV